MKPVYIGVPTLRRYDLLRELLVSAQEGSVRPELTVVVDNGKRPDKIAEAIYGLDIPVEVYEPETPLGVAASWNWLIDRLPQDRIITNDDIVFSLDSIEKMRDTPGDLVFGYGYSCFLIRDSAIRKIGIFDETISPGYAYWEDIDYDMRVRIAVARGRKFVQENAPCTMLHKGSQTNEWATPAEIETHHKKWLFAKANFMRKWAHLPREMQHPALGLELYERQETTVDR